MIPAFIILDCVGPHLYIFEFFLLKFSFYFVIYQYRLDIIYLYFLLIQLATYCMSIIIQFYLVK